MRWFKFNMEMTPLATVIGSMLVFLSVVAVVVALPYWEYTRATPEEIASPIWRARTAVEDAGREIYKQNGCQYCHSQYIRTQDYDYGVQRVSDRGDYVGDEPPFLGSERLGPDLSLEGGLRSDDWQIAHFFNPRHTRPESIMPPFKWMFDKTSTPTQDLLNLTAYVQSLGFKIADERMKAQKKWKDLAVAAFQSGPIKNMEWLHSHVPEYWMQMPSEYPATPAAVKRGERIYQDFCIGCHGPVGDGEGPAKPRLNPPGFNFTYLSRVNGPLGGMIYYQVMNGITGTAMMPFKTELESEKIWDVGSYVLVNFVGGDDWDKFDRGEVGIPASFETDVRTVREAPAVEPGRP